MRLKVDENLGHAAARVFVAAGHDTETARNEELSNAPDRALIAHCTVERRCLVTLDLDFANPLVFRPSDYAGLAVLRLPPKPSHQDLIDLCNTLAVGLEGGEIEGRLWIVQRGRIREYQEEEREESE